MRTISPTLPAPADLAVGMIGVAKDADIELDIRLEAVMEGVLITGTARAPLSGECSRCLDPLTSEIEVGFQELFFYPADTAFPGSAAGEDDFFLDGELLDLEPLFRDAVVLALPLSPVCSDDCRGLCTECGVKLAEAGSGHRHEKLDVRWAALQGLVVDNEDDQEG
jgi:uncharacterized protein